jgi:Domain of unknown function (DUF4148)
MRTDQVPSSAEPARTDGKCTATCQVRQTIVSEDSMNKFPIALIAAACICTTASALADSAQERSRAEVIAELDAARADGSLGAIHGEDSGSIRLSQGQAAGGLTRAQVVAEIRAARASGEADSLIGEDSGSFAMARAGYTSVPRAQVVAELEAAKASGEAAALVGEDSGSFHLAQRDGRERNRGAAPQWMLAESGQEDR